MKFNYLFILTAFTCFFWARSEASEVDNLHREIVALEIFIEQFEGSIKRDLNGAVPQHIDVAINWVGPTVRNARQNSENSLNSAFTRYCVNLDLNRDAVDLAKEIDGLMLSSLQNRKERIIRALRESGLDSSDLSSIHQFVNLTVRGRMTSTGQSAASLPIAQNNPTQFKANLVVGCQSHIASGGQWTDDDDVVERSFEKDNVE